MPVVSSQMDLLEKPLLYTQLGMVSFLLLHPNVDQTVPELLLSYWWVFQQW